MSYKTYIELSKNSLPTVQLSIWDSNGVEVSPLRATYKILSSPKNVTLVPTSSALIDGNKVYTQLPFSVMASAAEYDINWRIVKNSNDIIHHITKLLVVGENDIESSSSSSSSLSSSSISSS